MLTPTSKFSCWTWEVSALKGGMPTRSSKRMTPTDHQSAVAPTIEHNEIVTLNQQKNNASNNSIYVDLLMTSNHVPFRGESQGPDSQVYQLQIFSSAPFFVMSALLSLVYHPLVRPVVQISHQCY